MVSVGKYTSPWMVRDMQPSTHLALGLPFPGDVGDTLPKRRGKLFDGDMGGVKGGDDLTHMAEARSFPTKRNILKKLGEFFLSIFAYHICHLSTSANITYTIIYSYIYFKDLLKLNSAIVSFVPFISCGFFREGLMTRPSTEKKKHMSNEKTLVV